MGTQQFCLRWNNHQTNLLAVFDQLLQNEAFVDVTLACEGLSIKAHKMVLSACSPYFQSLFVDNPCQHPIVILKDVRFSELKAVVDFMYKGEVNVSQDQLSALLKTAETLKVKGLAEVTGGSDPSGSASDGVTRSTLGPSLSSQGGPPSQRSDGSLSPAPKRKRGRPSKRPSQDGDLEVVESLVDVVPDGPDSVPSNQDRSMDSTQNVKDLLSEPPQSMADQTLNTTTDMAYDGIPQDHTSNSRDSGMMMADQQQSSSSSSLGQLPATASTSGMSPGQGGSNDGGLSITITTTGTPHTAVSTSSSSFVSTATTVGTGSIYVSNISTAGSYNAASNYWIRSPYRTGPLKSWREETMAQAIRCIFTRGTPIIEASRSTNIPYPTLFFYTNKVKQILKPYERTVPPGGRNWGSQTSYKLWTKESMFTALKAVFARRMTYQQACDHFCIPVPTFYYYMSRVRKVLKPLEKEEYDADANISPDQLSIKGHHGKRLNIAENDLNAAILSVVCRTGKLLAREADKKSPGKLPSTGHKAVSPVPDDVTFRTPPVPTPLSGDMEFMSKMNVKPRGRQRSWKQEDMYLAIKAIVTHQMSLAKASRQYGIPYPTLKVYLKKVSSMPSPPDFSKEVSPASSQAWSKAVSDTPVYMDQPQQSPEVIPLVKDEPYETMQLSPCTLSVPASMPTVPPPQPPPPQPVQNMPVQANLQPTMSAVIPSTSSQAIAAAVASTSQSAIPPQVPAIPGTSSADGAWCEKCSCLLHSSDARAIAHHASFHEQGLSLCVQCGRSYINPSTFQRHLRSHEPGSDTFPCRYCPAVKRSRDLLDTHLRNMHSSSVRQLSDETEETDEEDGIIIPVPVIKTEAE